MKLKKSVLFTAISLLSINLAGCGGSSSTPQPTEPTPPAKTAPIVNAGEDLTVNELSDITLNATATDAESNITSYQWTQISGTEIALTAADTLSASFTAPEVTSDETIELQLQVTDSTGLSNVDTVSVVIKNVNKLPQVTLSAPEQVNEWDDVTLTSEASDNDGEIVTYTWQQTQGTTAELTTTDQATLQFKAPFIEGTAAQTLSFELTVTDNEGASNLASIDISVMPTASLSDIEFADVALQQCVNSLASENGWSRIIQVVELNCDNLAITSLAGVEKLTSLKTLNLPRNNIADLTPLAGILNITELSLEGNQVANISALSSMSGLTKLTLWNNPLSDLSPLALMTGLTYLDLDETSPNDLSPLSGLDNLELLALNQLYAFGGDFTPLSKLKSLKTIQLAENTLVNIEFLSAIKTLEEITIWDNDISDISPLTTLSNLKELYASSNKLTHIDGLSTLTGLENLYLFNNPIKSVQPLSQLTKLKELGLQYLDIDDLTELNMLSNMTNLAYLDIRGSYLSNIDMLAPLTQLTTLKLSITDILNFAALSKLTDMTTLIVDTRFDNNSINDISALAGMVKLTELDLGHALVGIHDSFSTISKLTQLTKLTLSGNRIIDVSFLTPLIQLKELDLFGNSIHDITPLLPLSQLEYLRLSGNRLLDCDQLAALQNVFSETVLHYSSTCSTEFQQRTYKIDTHDPRMGLSQVAVNSSGIIYVSLKNSVYAIDPEKGIQWYIHKDGFFKQKPIITPEGNLLVVETSTNDSTVHMVSAQGEILWSTVLPSPEIQLTLASDGRIYGYATVGEPFIYAIDSNGQFIWSLVVTAGNSFVEIQGFALPANNDGFYISALIDDGSTATLELIQFDRSGYYQWSQREFIQNQNSRMSAPLIGPTGLIYVATNTDVSVYDPDSIEVWHYNFGAGSGETLKGISMGSDGTVFVTTAQQISAINIDGTLRWRNTIANVLANATVGADGKLYYIAGTAGDSTLTALRQQDGTIAWSSLVEGQFSTPHHSSSPTVTTDSTVYVRSDSGAFLSLKRH